MITQTNILLQDIAIHGIPAHIGDAVHAYLAQNPEHILDLNLYAEPFYGDFNDSSAVLLTHNPGNSTALQKGVGSAFERRINEGPTTRGQNYYNIASLNDFPSPATRKWVMKINNEVTALLSGLIFKEKKLFIRDLIPYHSAKFGVINMQICIHYLYDYFFNQIFESALHSELYTHIDMSNRDNPIMLILARGEAWNGAFGLRSVGWDFVGKIYSNCYVYKFNKDKLEDVFFIDIGKYPENAFNHDIYIVVLTQIMSGGRLGIFKKNGYKPGHPINLSTVIDNYYNIKDERNPYFIKPNSELSALFSRLPHDPR